MFKNELKLQASRLQFILNSNLNYRRSIDSYLITTLIQWAKFVQICLPKFSSFQFECRHVLLILKFYSEIKYFPSENERRNLLNPLVNTEKRHLISNRLNEMHDLECEWFSERIELIYSIQIKIFYCKMKRLFSVFAIFRALSEFIAFGQFAVFMFIPRLNICRRPNQVY